MKKQESPGFSRGEQVKPRDKGRYTITIERDGFVFEPVTVMARTIAGALHAAWRIHQSQWQAGKDEK